VQSLDYRLEPQNPANLVLVAENRICRAYSIQRIPKPDIAKPVRATTLRRMPDRIQKPTGPAPWEPKDAENDGPKSPDVKKPDTKSILERMRKVDPEQARRYKQRTGQ
jgi:hypothetical protein